MEQINTTLPVEGAPLAVPGPYQVTSGPGVRLAGAHGLSPDEPRRVPVARHAARARLGQRRLRDRHRALRRPSCRRSHRTASSCSALPRRKAQQRRQATADDLRAAVDWASAENARAGSPLRGKIDTNQVAVMGQSCGGFLSLSLGADPRVDTIGMFNSGVQAPNPNAPAGRFPTTDAIKDLHGPVLLINGAERDFLTPASHATYEAITHVPAFYGARAGAGHTATVFHPGGGEYANVASNWLRWTFKKERRRREDVRRRRLLAVHAPDLGRGVEGLRRIAARPRRRSEATACARRAARASPTSPRG